MKRIILLVAAAVFLFGCNYDPKKEQGRVNNTNIIKKDTIFSEDIITELKQAGENGRPLQKLIFLDKNNNILKQFSKDTIFLRLPYRSEKFSKLNDDYRIAVNAISNNIKVLDQVDRNKFMLFVTPDSNPIIFDIYLSSKRNVFKVAHVDPGKHVKYEIDSIMFLSRRTIPTK